MLRLRSDLDAMSSLSHRSSMPTTRLGLEPHALDSDRYEVIEWYFSQNGNILAVFFDRYARLLDPMHIQRAQLLGADPGGPASPTMVNTAKHILATLAPLGFFRSIVSRICVASWVTIWMVSLGNIAKEALANRGHVKI